MIFGKYINRYYLKHAPVLLLGLAALLTVDYIQLLIPQLYRLVINGVNLGQVVVNGETLLFTKEVLLQHICLPMIWIVVLMVIGRFLWRICFFGSAVRVAADLRERMFDHSRRLSQQYYQVNKVGNLMSLYTNDLDTIQECFGDGVLMFFDALTLGLLALYKMWTMDVRLTLLELGYDSDNCCYGAIANEVQWDHESYEYLAAVSWREGHDPIILVQDRLQQHDQVLAIHVGEPIATMRDAENGFTDDNGDEVETFSIAIPEYAEGERPGTTRVLEEHGNDYWLDLIHGTPAFTPDGRLICAMNDMDVDTNRLTVDGTPFTPAGLQVREVLDVTDDDVLCVVQRTPEILPESDLPFLWQSNAADHDARSFDVVSIRYDGTWEPLTYAPGQWSMSRAGNGCVVTGRGMDDATVQMQHCMNIATTDENGTDVASMVVAPIENHAETPGFTPNVHFTRLGERELYTAIVLPSSDSEYAHEAILPVLMKPYGGPGFQQVIESQSFYWDAQWWADQGYIVVTTDGRGTTGRGPQWDRAIYETMKSATLEDQIDAVRALPEALEALAGENAAANVPQPDLSRVAMIGWSYGGFLSALAVLEAPETFAAACAGAPPTDWTLYDTHYTERYLGLDPAVYERNSIIADAPQLDRPLMLIHGFADDNVTIAHSLRLSQALMATGRKHTFLPLTGITHMTNDETVAENLLILQRDFLAEALG